MRFRDDERGQSVQIGAVLLFATLIVAFSSYQAFVVPDQNQEVEFNHNQQVQDEMQDLRNAIVSMAGGGSPTSTSVTLGTAYPSRAVAQNPGPVSGSLRTVGTDDPEYNVSVSNARANGETGELWNGTTRSYSTGAITYQPSYNRYGEAPVTVYEHTVLSNEFRSGTLVAADQTLVDGRKISLVTIDGSLSRSSFTSTSVDLRPISSSSRVVPVYPANDSKPVSISFTSRRSHEQWNETLRYEPNVVDVTSAPTAVSGPYHGVSVRLNQSVEGPYHLRMTRVGVGTDVEAQSPAYAVANKDDVDEPVGTGEERDLTVDVYDDYNNPVVGVPVEANASDGSLDNATVWTDDGGRATFEYTAPGNEGTDEVNVSIDRDADLTSPSFDPGWPNASQFTLSIADENSGDGSGGGRDSVWWSNPDDLDENEGADLSSCSPSSCTWNVGNSDDDTLTLESVLSSPYEGVEIDYAVSNSSVGTLSPGNAESDSDGVATTTLTGTENGTVDVLAWPNSGTALIELTVENVTTDGGDGGDGGTGSGNFVQYPYAMNDGGGNSEPNEDDSIPPYDAARGDFNHGSFPSITQESGSAALYPENSGGMDIGVALSVPDTAEYNASQYVLNIQYSRPGWADPASVRVVDADGNVLQESALSVGQNNLTMKLNGEASGYFERHDDLYVVYHSQGNVNLEIEYHRLLGDS